jgi:hypothetical protein
LIEKEKIGIMKEKVVSPGQLTEKLQSQLKGNLYVVRANSRKVWVVFAGGARELTVLTRSCYYSTHVLMLIPSLYLHV